VSDVPLPPSELRIIVLGYGNALRRDDAVGPHVAAAAEALRKRGLETMEVQQLTPELAEPIARADVAFFVDARKGGRDEPVSIVPLEPARSPRATLAHASNPRALLALAEDVYGRHPRSWLITVPVADLSLGFGLTPRARRGARQALDVLAALIEQATADRSSEVEA
jgi:hydrogenase maturation protease